VGSVTVRVKVTIKDHEISLRDDWKEYTGKREKKTMKLLGGIERII